jgi:hypothetical protein
MHLNNTQNGTQPTANQATSPNDEAEQLENGVDGKPALVDPANPPGG